MSTRFRRTEPAAKARSAERLSVRKDAGRLELAAGDEVSRLFIIAIGNHVHRHDLERRRLYATDLDLAAVAETVGLAGVDTSMRDPHFRDAHRTFKTVIGVAGQRPVNALSVAAATGIPRETVRRKLKRLVELGFILQQGRGRYVLKPGTLQQPAHLASFDRAIRETVRFMNECLEQGLVQWKRAPEEET